MKNEIELKHGKLYDCSIDCNGKLEKSSIIPLAKDKKSERMFVMTDARNLYKQNPNYVKEIIQMTFEYIWNDGIRSDYPFEYEALTLICTPEQDGSLLSFSEDHILGFVETDVI